MLTSGETAELVVCARAGERRAMEVLATSYLRTAYAIALAILRRPADAEDVAQDAIVTALHGLSTCRQPARFSAWLSSIVHNLACNYLARRRLREPACAPESPEPVWFPPPLENGRLRKRLVAALAILTPTQRQVTLLHDVDGCTHAEVAATLGISELMSRQHLFKAREIMRRLLVAKGAAEASPMRPRSSHQSPARSR